jgi:hypothetical protein
MSQTGFSVGFKAGYGYSQYFFRNFVEQNFVPVNQYGLVISQMNKKNFGIEIDMLYTQKAWEEKFISGYSKQVLINYLEFPFLSSYKLGKNKSGLLFYGGMHISYALSIDSLNQGIPAEADSSIIQYAPFEYNKFNYGLTGGIGYQLNLGRNIFQLQLMYSQGLQNLFERDYSKIYRSLNQNLYLNFIYKVSLVKRKKEKTDPNKKN